MATKKIQEIAQTLVLGPVNQYLESGGATAGSAKHLLTYFPQTVGTLAQLTALVIANAAANQTVVVTGGAAIGDGGGGTFYYDPASAAAPNGTTILAPNVGVGRWLRASSGDAPTSLVLLKANNLSDLPSAAAARANLGLGTAATMNSGAFDAAGVAAGFFALALVKANNLSDVPNPTQARINIGASSSAVTLDKNLNLSDLTNIVAARANLGLGDMALQSSGAVAITGGTVLNLTNLTAASLAAMRAIKLNLNLLINVKDYGATGNGINDDTAAINQAIAALTNYSALFFPPGRYNHTGLATITGLTCVRIFSAGATLYQTVQANNSLIVDRTCSGIMIDHIILSGGATSRLNGVGLRFDASNSYIDTVEIGGCSDFAFFIGQHSNATPTKNVQLINCVAKTPKGDGFHFDNVDGVTVCGCTALDTGDDSFACVGYETAMTQAKNVSFFGCRVKNAGFRGMALLLVKGINVSDFVCDTAIGAGIEVGDDGGNVGVFNEDVTLRNCDLISPITSPGPFGGFNMYFIQRGLIENVTVRDPVSGSAIAVADFDDLTIRECEVVVTRAGFCRGLVCNDGAGASGRNFRAAWGDLTVDGFGFRLKDATNNEAIYLNPTAGKTIANLMVIGCTGSQAPAGNYIVYNRVLTAAKIGNNTCLEARTIANGGSGVIATLFNNN